MGDRWMHTDIFNNIDTLVAMAGSSLDAFEIETELISINKEIQDKKQAIEDLKSMMNDHRYFNASNELVDKNIELSLKSKIGRLNRKLKSLQLKLDKVRTDKNVLDRDISALKEKIEENKKYIELLETKTGKNDSDNLKQILNQEKEHLHSLEQDLANKENKQEEINKELELTEQALDELSKKRDEDEARLQEVEDNLNNPNAYIDEELKRADEEQMESLNVSLEELQQRKLEYLTDANMVGADAKELIVNGNHTEALAKIKELLEIVKSKPYMDVTSLSVLDEELEKKENERAELSSYIENKDYTSMNSEAAKKRIEYLHQGTAQKQQEIEQLNSLLDAVNQDIDGSLASMIRSLEEEISNITKEIDEYRSMLEDNTKSRKTKANLENAILKKEREKEVVEKVLDNYKKDLLFQITISNSFLKMAQRLEQVISDYQEETSELNRLSDMDGLEKDYVLEEKDKEKLKNINEEIRQIKNRKNFDKTPDEIYDQIEMLLAQVKPNVTDTKEVRPEEPLDLGIDDLFLETDGERLKVVEMIPAQTVTSSGGHTYGA